VWKIPSRATKRARCLENRAKEGKLEKNEFGIEK